MILKTFGARRRSQRSRVRRKSRLRRGNVHLFIRKTGPIKTSSVEEKVKKVYTLIRMTFTVMQSEKCAPNVIYRNCWQCRPCTSMPT
ncbi:hypothetical protein NPIL_272811 [Nephila pilipes]|uniref:Uncharacterized protein n=1 Tax=Nephila pilipes TaxID=299642 RepID=A0A8X6R3X8_NEPPI|nr:hypothetical protein NPIL_272811 [Nephila pilipes]